MTAYPAPHPLHDRRAPAPPLLDVAELPSSALDHRAAIWWGNVLLLGIESSMFLIMFAGYFYVWQNYDVWPPVQSYRAPSLYDTRPGLLFATLGLVATIVGVVPMAVADRAALRMRERPVKIALPLAGLCASTAIVFEWLSTRSLHFNWDDNAYASIAWITILLHVLHDFAAGAEAYLMSVWVWSKGMDRQHARDVRTVSIYWYWISAMWVLVYLVVFVSPYLLRKHG